MQTPVRCFYKSKIARYTSFLTIYGIIFYGKELICHEVTDPLVCFNQHALSVGLKKDPHSLDHMIFNIYLELACHDEQNGSQSFKLQARITKLWRFKARKVEKSWRRLSSHLQAWFKANSFFRMQQRMVGCGKEW